MVGFAGVITMELRFAAALLMVRVADAFTNPEATELGQKFNLPLRYDEKVDREAKAEASKFFAASLKK